jgi:TolB protein
MAGWMVVFVSAQSPMARAATTRPDGAQLVPITIPSGSAQNPCWSPTGDRLAFTNFTTRYNQGKGIVYTVASTGGGLLATLSRTTGQSVNLPGQCWSTATDEVTFSSDATTSTDQIFRVRSNGTNLTQVMNRPTFLNWEPSFSPVLPDATQWIVFESHTGGTSPGEIWKIRTDGTGLTRLTSGFDDRQPEWSPAGDRILFQRRWARNDWDIMTIDPNGGSLVNVTNDHATFDTDGSWSPSGNYIVYSSNGPNIPIADIFVIPATGGQRIQVTSNPTQGLDGAPGWSPDGTKIAFESARGDPDKRGNTTIWVIAAPLGIS